MLAAHTRLMISQNWEVRCSVLLTDVFPLKMGQIRYTETSLRNYNYSLRNNTERRSSHILRGWNLKSRKMLKLLFSIFNDITLIKTNKMEVFEHVYLNFALNIFPILAKAINLFRFSGCWPCVLEFVAQGKRYLWICGNKMPTRCTRGFYCRSYCLLNMFREPLCPSSRAQEYYTVVAACGISCCGFQVAGLVWSWGLCVRFAGCCSILHCIILLSSWWWA